MNSNEDKERVRDANDIVDVIAEFVPLKAAGKYFKGLCPFHQEKTPSFTVSPDRQTFKCFGCGVGGDVYEFLVRKEGITFPEAMQRLAQRGHITLSREKQQPETEADREKRQLYPVVAWAMERFQQALRSPESGKRARSYLQKRNVSEELITQFGLGLAPAGWDNLLRAGERDHYSREILEKAGMVATQADTGRKYDRFRNRLMFPIFDPQQRPVAFGGRQLGPGEPKYLNSPETPLFHKGELLYALPLAREAVRRLGRLVLTEGYMDVIACHGANVRETVACLGTALTEHQVKLIQRYTQRVFLLYDMDAAGIQATLRAFELLQPAGVQIRVVTLPGSKDADEYIQTHGPGLFRQRLEQAQTMVEFRLDLAGQKHDAKTIDGKLEIIRAVGPLIRLLPPDGVEYGESVHLVAERLHLQDRQILSELERLPALLHSNQAKAAVVAKPAPASPDQPEIPRNRKAFEEESILSTLLQFPEEIEAFQDVINPRLFTLAEYQSLAGYVFSAQPADLDRPDAWYQRLLEELPLEAKAVAERLHAMNRGTPDPGKVLRDCLNRLQILEVQEQLGDIQAKIKAAESDGDMETLKQLAQDKQELAAKLKQFGVVWK